MDCILITIKKHPNWFVSSSKLPDLKAHDLFRCSEVRPISFVGKARFLWRFFPTQHQWLHFVGFICGSAWNCKRPQWWNSSAVVRCNVHFFLLASFHRRTPQKRPCLYLTRLLYPQKCIFIHYWSHPWHLSSVFFFVVPCPIHWLNAYANASARLRGLERVPTPEVFNARCLRRCLRGVLCWMAMLLVTKYFPKRFTVGALHATLDLASFVLVSVAAFLGRWSRCLRAASAEPTRAYAVEPRQIPRNHLSYSYKFICITSCTYSGNYIYICINKLVDNLHIPSHLENANEHLPTRLAYAKKI